MNLHRLALNLPRSVLIMNGRTLDKLSNVFRRGYLTTSIRDTGKQTQISISEICAVTSIVKSKPGCYFNAFPRQRKRLLESFTGSLSKCMSVRLVHTTGGNNNNIEGREKMLPPLMPFPPIVWPKFMNAVRNWFFVHFIIKPYFDKEFSIHDFLAGAKEAVSVIANNMSEGKLDELEGLVEASALAQIRESLSKFTVFQQQLLRVATEDIFFAFPYQVGIIIPDENPRESTTTPKPPQTRHVEITVCLHVLRGLAEKQRGGETGAAFNFQEFTSDERNKYNVMICNYRFFKDFTEGCPDPSWIVNMVSHFLPAELNQP